MEDLDNQKIKANGIVFTPTPLANFLAEKLFNYLDLDKLERISILDPAIGNAELAIRLMTKICDKYPDKQISLFGYDINDDFVKICQELILEKFPKINCHIEQKDFLDLEHHSDLKHCSERLSLLNLSNDQNIKQNSEQKYDLIIANPPYVRRQRLGDSQVQKISKLSSLKGKVDIYYAFFIKALQLLKDHGVAGFITSNKYLTINSGKYLREYLFRHAEILEIVDFGDTKIFNASVLPCITIFRKLSQVVPQKIKIFSIYCSSTNKIKENNDRNVNNGNYKNENDNDINDMNDANDCNKNDQDNFNRCTNIYDCLDQAGNFVDQDGQSYQAKAGFCQIDASNFSKPWVLTTEYDFKHLEIIGQRQWKTFGDIGKIRVGIKTTADNVFIFPRDQSLVDLELVKPLITHRNAGSYIGSKEVSWSVLYPYYDKNGQRMVADLEQYPKTKAYLLQHYEALNKRSYIKKSQRLWYEIWVPQNPSLWQHKKIVFRDIAEFPQFWLVVEDAVINGDCYWIEFDASVQDDLIYLMLAIANSKFILDFYDKKFNTRLYSNKRRFMSQYVQEFPLPNPDMAKSKQIIAYVQEIIAKNVLTDDVKEKIDDLVYQVFND